ncbi:hypothetical protein SAMN00808754_1779 [Thermanaeromonas toyohensis ToBE]|uniref:Uncharacterized protein n=1 Tax=Thermanaeromonas toyohensis ToBE TaxID=698762 RepID=A0A1W1VV78_9FIRM|nr:hypothetical protein [Thermanaeromonas toyohensis]SMB97173.1 hypothetical protein SAMN00808754_1779 [Thermanaeromonas toyohensis ToBE]
MFGQGWRLHYVILACFLSLTLLGGGHLLYQRFLWEKSLEKRLQSIPQVEGVTLKREKDRIEVELGPTPDLKQTYLQVEEALRDFYRQNPPQLVIRDRRSASLVKVWEEAQFVVYEAAVRGTFTDMAREVEEKARIRGAEARLAVDGKRIYVALYKDSYFLYEIIPLAPLRVPEEREVRERGV